MPNMRTSRRFNQAPDLEVSKQGGRAVAGFTNNTDLPNPPVPATTINDQKLAFDAAIVSAAAGGKLAHARKEMARAALLDSLNKNASYVDIACNDDMAILLSSGFEAVSTNRSQVVLNPPEVVGADYGQTGELRLRLKGDAHRKAVQGRIKAVGGEFGPVVTFRSAREIIFRGLTAGTTYVMQVCGLGGSTGHSDWSEPVEKMAL